jgi:DNA repair protein RadC
LLAKTGKYEVIDKEKAQLQQWKLDLEKERAEKKRTLEIAKKMKGKGYEIDEIKEMTGLNKSDIKKL